MDLTNLSNGLGTQAAYALDVAGIYCNRNTIPDEPCSPFYPSGLRLGTPLVTTRGMKETEMTLIANWIARVMKIIKDDILPEEKKARAAFVRNFKEKSDNNQRLLTIADEVKALASTFPLFAW